MELKTTIVFCHRVCVTESCVGESDNNDHLMIVSAGADFQH